MASRSALTEEGRTRIRNFQGRLTSYLVLWIVVAVTVVVAAIWLKTRYGYLPLQRLYLSQYIKASIKSVIPRTKPSNYTLLVRINSDFQARSEELVFCTDAEVTPVRDEFGIVKFDPKLGPFFRLREDIPYKYFYWRVVQSSDQNIYLWMRDHIYQGKSLPRIYWTCLIPLPLIVLAGMILSVKLDVRINREYEEGQLLRGIRLLDRHEYAGEMKELGGLGLPVFRPRRSR